MASRMSVVEGALGAPQVAFLASILPPFVCQYLMGVLVQLDGTRLYRLALLPITVWFAWRATWVNPSKEGDDPVNVTLVIQMYAIATLSAVWALAREPYRRLSAYPVDPKAALDATPVGISNVYWNTVDLLMNPRGLGWNWPRGLVVPKPAVDTDSRVVFALVTTANVVFHGLAMDVCLQIIRALNPETFGSLQGGTLFDGSLPPVPELVRALVVSVLAGFVPYFAVQNSHQLLALVGVVVFRQHPSQWPPLFDAPWRSTSLSELWGRRWHQMMRNMVLTLGGVPLDHVFGRLGGVLGAFLASGLFHDAELQVSVREGQGGIPGVLIVFWVMNGVGVVLERVWARRTGRAVGGVWGRMWMVGWLLLWGVPAVNEYAKAGRYAVMALPGGIEPSLWLVAWVQSRV